MHNEELVRAAVAQQRDAALNALAFAHAEIATLKAQVEELQAKLANGQAEARDEGADKRL